jgi:hypothetical protein
LQEPAFTLVAVLTLQRSIPCRRFGTIKFRQAAFPPKARTEIGCQWIGHSMNRKYASTFAQSAKNVSFYSSTRPEVLQDRLARCGVGDRTRRSGIPEWKRVYLKKTEERRLLHQARVLGWGKEKRYYYACKTT